MGSVDYMLTITDTLPEKILDVKADQLLELLDGPTLFHLPGILKEPIFISVLLHGNEETGFFAVQQLLKEYQHKELPRSLSLFIGNISAAKYHVRKLDKQPDYNRIWPGCPPTDTPEERPFKNMMQQIVDEMAKHPVFASIDIHNTSGHNPHYACINHLENSFLQLANIFGRTVVYFTRPKGVQTMAFASMCPAITLECGQVTDHDAVNHALSYLKKVILLPKIPSQRITEEDIDLFHTTAIVKVPEYITFAFADTEQAEKGTQENLNFVNNLDGLNFREIPAGTVISKIGAHANNELLLDVQNIYDEQSFNRYFFVSNNELKTNIPLMPSMLSTNGKAIRQDCLCYLMERIKTDGTLY